MVCEEPGAQIANGLMGGQQPAAAASCMAAAAAIEVLAETGRATGAKRIKAPPGNSHQIPLNTHPTPMWDEKVPM